MSYQRVVEGKRESSLEIPEFKYGLSQNMSRLGGCCESRRTSIRHLPLV